MEELWQGLVKAIQLVITFDSEVVAVAGRSLWISATSSSIAALICLFLGSLIHFNRFCVKRVLISIIHTFFSVPTVAVGLFVFVLFSRAGPLGELGLMFTPAVMIIGQVLLIIPVMLGFIISALSGVDKAVVDTTISLGANRFKMAIAILR